MTERNTIDLRLTAIISFILLAAFSRLIPHPPNFAPIGAMALFGSAYFNKRYLSYILPIAPMWYCLALFGTFEFLQYRFPKLRLQTA